MGKSDQLDHRGLRGVAPADAGAGNAGVAAAALHIAGSDLLEYLVDNVLTGHEGHGLAVRGQVALLPQGNHFLSQRPDLLAAGNGALHPAVIQEIGHLLAEHRPALVSGLAELACSGHSCSPPLQKALIAAARRGRGGYRY